MSHNVKETDVADVQVNDDGVPSQVNGYRVLLQIGEGTFSKVYHCQDGEGRSYALKILNKSFLKRKREYKKVDGKMVFSNAFQKIQKEVAIMKKLAHDNLVKLYEIIDSPADDKMFLVLEFITGGQVMRWDDKAFRYRCPRNASEVCTTEQVRTCLRDVANALEYLHTNSICHRDIKPENILLAGSGASYKLADFGVAYMVEDTEKKTLRNTEGTYHFLAPECTTGDEYDPYQVDIWALGVTIYTLLFGTLPFGTKAASLSQVMEAIRDEPLEFAGPVDPGCRQLLGRMLDKDPRQRIPIGELLAHPWLTAEDDSAAAWAPPASARVEVTREEIEAAFTPVNNFILMARLKIKMATRLARVRKSIDMATTTTIAEPSPPPSATTSDASPQLPALEHRGSSSSGGETEGHPPLSSTRNADLKAPSTTTMAVTAGESKPRRSTVAVSDPASPRQQHHHHQHHHHLQPHHPTPLATVDSMRVAPAVVGAEVPTLPLTPGALSLALSSPSRRMTTIMPAELLMVDATPRTAALDSDRSSSSSSSSHEESTHDDEPSPTPTPSSPSRGSPSRASRELRLPKLDLAGLTTMPPVASSSPTRPHSPRTKAAVGDASGAPTSVVAAATAAVSPSPIEGEGNGKRPSTLEKRPSRLGLGLMHQGTVHPDPPSSATITTTPSSNNNNGSSGDAEEPSLHAVSGPRGAPESPIAAISEPLPRRKKTLDEAKLAISDIVHRTTIIGAGVPLTTSPTPEPSMMLHRRRSSSSTATAASVSPRRLSVMDDAHHHQQHPRLGGGVGGGVLSPTQEETAGLESPGRWVSDPRLDEPPAGATPRLPPPGSTSHPATAMSPRGLHERESTRVDGFHPRIPVGLVTVSTMGDSPHSSHSSHGSNGGARSGAPPPHPASPRKPHGGSPTRLQGPQFPTPRVLADDALPPVDDAPVHLIESDEPKSPPSPTSSSSSSSSPSRPRKNSNGAAVTPVTTATDAVHGRAGHESPTRSNSILAAITRPPSQRHGGAPEPPHQPPPGRSNPAPTVHDLPSTPTIRRMGSTRRAILDTQDSIRLMLLRRSSSIKSLLAAATGSGASTPTTSPTTHRDMTKTSATPRIPEDGPRRPSMHSRPSHTPSSTTCSVM